MKKIVLSVAVVLLHLPSFMRAQAEPFIGQIAFVPYNFAPRGWAECNGQLLSIAQNTALFSLLGTTYGGNGTTNFALPDMRGRMLIHNGQGAGLSPRQLGQTGGSENVTLTQNQMPVHNHTVNAVSTDGDDASPTGNLPANTKTLDKEYSTANANTTMKGTMVNSAGGGQPHENMSPFLTMKCIIALQGVFPTRD